MHDVASKDGTQLLKSVEIVWRDEVFASLQGLPHVANYISTYLDYSVKWQNYASFERAVKNGWIYLLKQIAPRSGKHTIAKIIISAARHGQFAIVKWLATTYQSFLWSVPATPFTSACHHRLSPRWRENMAAQRLEGYSPSTSCTPWLAPVDYCVYLSITSAIKNGHLVVVRYLHNMSGSLPPKDIASAMHIAIMKGHLSILNFLFEQHGSLWSESSVAVGATLGRMEIVDYCLDKHPLAPARMIKLKTEARQERTKRREYQTKKRRFVSTNMTDSRPSYGGLRLRSGLSPTIIRVSRPYLPVSLQRLIPHSAIM